MHVSALGTIMSTFFWAMYLLTVILCLRVQILGHSRRANQEKTYSNLV